MKYAMSDLHGRYDIYAEMLRKINFAARTDIIPPFDKLTE